MLGEGHILYLKEETFRAMMGMLIRLIHAHVVQLNSCREEPLAEGKGESNSEVGSLAGEEEEDGSGSWEEGGDGGGGLWNTLNKC
eukprot:jgi/Tetstr1/433493/TSEL_022763.t1